MSMADRARERMNKRIFGTQAKPKQRRNDERDDAIVIVSLDECVTKYIANPNKKGQLKVLIDPGL